MIYLLCGMIASGKSTLARKLAKEKNALIINDDDIVTMLHGDYTSYDQTLKPLYKSIENHILTAAILAGRDVIVDRGVNIKRSSRQRWIELAKSLDQDIVAVITQRDWPEVHAKRRFEHDKRGHSYEYWLKVANYHNREYVEPSYSEGYINIIPSDTTEKYLND
jgi:predicted kinase